MLKSAFKYFFPQILGWEGFTSSLDGAIAAQRGGTAVSCTKNILCSSLNSGRNCLCAVAIRAIWTEGVETNTKEGAFGCFHIDLFPVGFSTRFHVVFMAETHDQETPDLEPRLYHCSEYSRIPWLCECV